MRGGVLLDRAAAAVSQYWNPAKTGSPITLNNGNSAIFSGGERPARNYLARPAKARAPSPKDSITLISAW